MYLVPDPGQDEDNQDQENLKDPQDAGQGAEEVAASPNTPGQEPDNELAMVSGAQHVSMTRLEEAAPPEVVWDTLT